MASLNHTYALKSNEFIISKNARFYPVKKQNITQVSRDTRIHTVMQAGKLPKSADKYGKKLPLKIPTKKSQAERDVSRDSNCKRP